MHVTFTCSNTSNIAEPIYGRPHFHWRAVFSVVSVSFKHLRRPFAGGGKQLPIRSAEDLTGSHFTPAPARSAHSGRLSPAFQTVNLARPASISGFYRNWWWWGAPNCLRAVYLNCLPGPRSGRNDTLIVSVPWGYTLCVSGYIPLYDKVMQPIALLSLRVVVQHLVHDTGIPNLSEDWY